MRLAVLAATIVLAVAAPRALAAQAPDQKVDSTTPPPTTGTCVERDKDGKCQRPTPKGDRTVRTVGEAAAPTVKQRVRRTKGGTRGAGNPTGGIRPRMP